MDYINPTKKFQGVEFIDNSDYNINSGVMMSTLNQLKKILKKHRPELIKKYHIRQMGVFGSYARGDEKQSSDLDIMVDFEKPIGLDFVTLAEELESVLGMKVDLVSAKSIKPRMMEAIKEELIYV